jgi:hypothetical protein
MNVQIAPNDRGDPPGKLADAELHFTDGPLKGLKLTGFSIWKRHGDTAPDVVFPALQYLVNGEGDYTSLLVRGSIEAIDQVNIRDLILQAFRDYEVSPP